MVCLIVSLHLVGPIQASVAPQPQYLDAYQFPEWSHPGEITLSQNQDCLVPCDEIVNGGPPPDGIPSIENPRYYSVEKADQDLDETEVIMGVEIDGVMHGFPYSILNWHEIVNHRIDGAILSITYCPLTGTGIPFQTQSTFGTSGNLYENNLVYYDRDTDSYWSQMLGLAIKGDRLGERHPQQTMVETTWEAFSAMYPDAKILSRDTGYERDYDSYPYANLDYLNSRSIIFDSTYDPDTAPYNLYHPKQLTLVLEYNETWGLVPFVEFNQENPKVINHAGLDLVILYDESVRLVMPFHNPSLGLTLHSDQSGIDNTFGLNVYEDQHGNLYNIKGQIVEGPDKGSSLTRFVRSYNAFWFAAISFFDHEGLLYADNEVSVLTGQDKSTRTNADTKKAPLTTVFLVTILALPLLVRWRRDT